jgi:Protein of unknown function (DUF1501)
VMEAGSLTPDVERTGWVGRAMAVAKLGSLTFSLPIPLILRGNENTFNHYPAKLSDAADVIYDKVLGDWSSDIGLRDTANKLMMKRELGENSRSTSELMRFASDQMSRDDGPRVGLIDLVGFDTHALQGNEFGAQAKMLSQMDSLIRAFRAQMGSKWENTIVVTVTEFGRTVSENGSKGTDHGYASCIFLVGGLVRKAQVVTDWPSLKSSKMFEGRDLMMTIDARDVYTEVISKVFSVDPKQVAKEVFFHHKVKRDLNILRNDGEPISKPLSNTSVEEISPYNTGVQSISDSSLCLFALNNEQSDYAETDSRKKYVKIAKSKGLSPFKCKELLDKGIDN